MIVLGRGWSFGRQREASYSMFFWGLVVMLIAVPVVSQAGEAELKMEIDKLWAKMANMEGTSMADIRGTAPAEIQGGQNWTDRVTVSGVVEVETGVYDDDIVTESDIAVATVELGIDAEVSDFSSAHVLFLSEDGGAMEVDEAAVTIGNTEKNPLYMTAGKMYVPFGNFESQMVSDPLTLDLGETGEDALLLGVEVAGFYASVYSFNGDADDGGDDRIEHYGTNAGYAFESDAVSIDVGGAWISSIQDSDGLTDALGLVPGAQNVLEYVGGYGAHLIAGLGPVTLIGEYVGVDDDLIGAGTDSQVSAYNVEAGVVFPLGSREGSIAVGYQATDEAGGAFVEERIVAALAVEILDGTALALEYLHEEDYDGFGTDWDIYTLQLAAEF
ncbi:MAG: LbtU family siderophore porin [Thermodesulfobacteriota bacterium]